MASETLRIGCVPLIDSAPLVVADPRGFFAAAGVRVVLSPERGWATLPDKLVFGAVEAAQLPGPMPLGLALGGMQQQLAAPLAFDPNEPPSAAAALRWFEETQRRGHLPGSATAQEAGAGWRPDLWHLATDSLGPAARGPTTSIAQEPSS